MVVRGILAHKAIASRGAATSFFVEKPLAGGTLMLEAEAGLDLARLEGVGVAARVRIA